MKWEQDYDVENFACAWYGEKNMMFKTLLVHEMGGKIIMSEFYVINNWYKMNNHWQSKMMIIHGHFCVRHFGDN
jgi:hypothetical protein